MTNLDSFKNNFFLGLPSGLCRFVQWTLCKAPGPCPPTQVCLAGTWQIPLSSKIHYYIFLGFDQEKCLFCDHVGSQPIWNERSDFNFDCLNVEKKRKAYYVKEQQYGQKREKKKKVDEKTKDEKKVPREPVNVITS